MRFASLITKVTRQCNLRCTYCYSRRSGPDQVMRFEVLARLISSALQVLDQADFVWHGGEPTLLPLSFFEKALAMEHRFRRSDQVVCNILQTNGTRITHEWGRFLKRAGFSVGISIDGPPEIHDRFRRYPDGRPSFADVLAGLDILRQYEVPFGVLVVVDQATLEWGADRLFEFLITLGERGARCFACLTATPAHQQVATSGTPAPHSLDPVRMSGFLIELYEHWLEHGDPQLSIRPLQAIRQRLEGRDGYCYFAENCFDSFFQVEPGGAVTACDVFQGDERYTFGNIAEQDFAAILAGDRLQGLRREREREVTRLCGHCPELPICRGGCPYLHHLALRYAPDSPRPACGLRGLIEHVRRHQCEEQELARRLPDLAEGGTEPGLPLVTAERL